MPELSVIVCTFNRSQRLSRTLQALTNLEPDAEVIVVDDASTDDTASVVHDATLVRHRRNRGAAAARNSGAMAARGEWLLFIDDDVVPEPGAIDKLWARRDPSTCLVPVVRNADGSILNATRCYWRLGELATEYEQHPRTDVCYPVGACLFIHRDAFARAGGFDERIRPCYVEDDAFGADLRRIHIAVHMVADAVVHHDQHGGDASPERQREISALQYHHRWVYYAVAERGRRRAIALAVGVPRSVQEAYRTRSTVPLRGYLRTLKRLPELLREKPAPGPLTTRADVAPAPPPFW